MTQKQNPSVATEAVEKTAPAISGGASVPCTRTGSKITFAIGYRHFKILIISRAAAPAADVIIPILSG